MKNNSIFIAETAIVADPSLLGAGTHVWNWVQIMPDVKVGEKCNICNNCFIESGVTIGNNVKIKNNIALFSGVTIEDDVFLGPNCVFTNVINPRSFISRKDEFRKTIIKQGASIGANATIVCGVTIGKYALIGAGSVITRDIPDYALVYGTPARIHGYVCKCGNKLAEGESCPVCGTKYPENK